MKRLIIRTWAAVFAGATLTIPLRAAGVCVVSLDQIVPVQHDVAGGGTTYLYGSGFCPGLEVLFNGKSAAIVLYNSAAMACRVPANPAGTYDVVVRDAATHVVLDTLPMGIQYVVGKLPAPEDFFAVRLDDNRVKLSWSNLVNNDTILVLRNSQTLISLPGGTTTFTDNNAPYTVQSIRYELIGTAPGGLQSFTTSVENIPYVCYEHLGLGATGRADDSLIPLLGLVPDDDEVRICFRLAAAANALGVKVHALRYSLHGQLKARIHPAGDPSTTLDTITFSQFDEILRDADWTEGFSGAALAAGDYILGFFIDGDPGEAFLYAITADAAREDARGLMVHPCVPPPYPLVKIEPICGNVPPNIISITTQIVARAASGDLLNAEPGGYFGGLLPLGDRTITLHCDAEDVDSKAIRYFWHFGHSDPGSTHESGSPFVTHEFPAHDTYRVTCTVFDNAGAFDSETIGVVVTSLALGCPAGGPPCITVLSSPNSPAGSDGDPGALHFLPDLDPFLEDHVVQTYQVQVTPPEGAMVNTVSMRLLDPDTGLCISSTAGGGCMQDAATNLNPGHPFDPANWESVFNTDQIPNIEAFDVEVTANASGGMQAVRVFPNMPLCDRPFWVDSAFDGIVASTIEYDIANHIYGLTSEMPPNPIYEETFTIPLPGGFDIDLYNKLVAGAFFSAELQNDEWTPGPLRFDFQATLLGEELASEHIEFELSPPGIVRFPCDTFGIHYQENNISIYDQEWEWELFRATVYNGFVGPIPVNAEVSVDVGLSVDVEADVDVLLQVASPHVDVTATLTPTVTAWADANLDVEVLFGVASATGTLRPSIGITLPVTLDIEDTNLSVGVTDCLTLSLEAKVRGCLFLAGCVSTGWMDIFSDSFGDGCPAGLLDGTAFQAVNGYWQDARITGIIEPEPPPLKYPAISISPDGARTMIVYTKNVDPNPDVQYNAELYYSLDSSADYSEPAPLYSPADSFTQRDSNVVFLNNTTALAVWTEGRLTHAEETALDRNTVAGMNGIFKNQDIAFALWTSAGGWAPRQFLVSDATPDPLLSDGRAAVAPILNNVANPNSAWVVWVRSDNADLLDAGGNVTLSGLSVYTRRIFNGAPSGSIIKLSAGDEANPAADLQPDLAVSPSGNVVLAVWVRDLDSDFDTPGDRMLMYSVRSGGVWSAAAAVTSPATLPGVLMPSVALSSDDDGMIAFTVRDSRVNGPNVEVAGDGNRDVVYTIEIENTMFQSPTPLQRPRHVRNGLTVQRGQDRDGKVYGRNPIVRYLDSTNAAVVMRTFDGYGSQGGDGELAAATIDLAQATPKWSFVRDLTQDAYRDWEIAAAVGPGGVIRTVRDTASPSAPTGFDGIMAHQLSTNDLDIAIDHIRVSNPHTPPGTQVTLTAVIRNDGWRAPQTTSPVNLRIGEVVNNVFRETAVIPFSFTALPDQTQTVVTTMWMPVRTSQWRFIVQPIEPELDGTDNVEDVILGVLPPVMLQCADATQGTDIRASLTWENGEIYERVLVYRDDRLLAFLPGERETYVDQTVGPGAHTWSVRGRIGRGESEAAAAECELTLYAPMDYDQDLDVDDDDLDIFDFCRTGPEILYDPDNLPPGCTLTPDAQDIIAADFDRDGDVDHDDYGRFQRCYGGAGVTPDRDCLD